MAKKTVKKSGKALDKKDMKKTKGGIMGILVSPTQGTITGNLNGDGKPAINNGGFNNAGFTGGL